MGNQTTKTMSEFQLEVLLDQVPHISTYVIVEELKKINVFDTDLQFLACELFDHALKFPSASRKYAEIARKLCVLTPPDRYASNIQWTLQDVINRIAHDYFTKLKVVSTVKKYEIAKFLGDLYNEDLLSDERMAIWIGSMSLGFEAQAYKRGILSTIKAKVVQQQNAFQGSDPYVNQLYQQLIQEGYIKTSGTPRDVRPEPTEVDDFVCIPSLAPSSTNPRPIPIADEFELHLKSLNTQHVTAFSINKFKTCSDQNRKQCAIRMLNYALVDSTKAKALAALTLSIMRQGNVKLGSHAKAFNVHLNEACEEALKIFKNFNYKSGQSAENLGIFIAELYSLESVIRANVINTWLEEMKPHADRDNRMLKIFLSVFKIAFEKMRRSNKRNAQVYINHMNVYRQQHRLPKQFVVWHDNILASSGIGHDRSRSLSTVSNASTGSASGSASGSVQGEVRATGAIKKVPILEPNITTEICTNFQGYLNGIQEKKMVHFEFSKLNTCPEAAVKGCALILIEHCLLNIDDIALYSSIVQQTVLGSLTVANRKKVFLNNLRYFLYTDMEKFLKPDKPGSSNWQRVANIGKLLYTLYNDSILDFTSIQVWLSSLEKAVANSSIEARNEMKVCIDVAGRKFMQERPNVYQNYAQLVTAFDRVKTEKGAGSGTIFASNGDGESQDPEYDENAFDFVFSKDLSEDYREFAFILSELKLRNIDNIKSSLDNLKITTQDQMEDFVEFYFQCIVNNFGKETLILLAKEIDENFSKSNLNFKDTLKTTVLINFHNSIASYRLLNEKDASTALLYGKIVGELFNNDLLSETNIFTIFDKLTACDYINLYQLAIFKSLLKIIALNLIKHGDKLSKYYKTFKLNVETFVDAASYLTCQEILKILKDIWKLSKQAKVGESSISLLFQDILTRLTKENFKISVLKLKSTSVDSRMRLCEIATIFIDTAISNPDTIHLYVKFLAEIQSDVTFEDISGEKIEFREILKTEIYGKFGALVTEEIELKNLPKVMGFMYLVAEMYSKSMLSVNNYLSRLYNAKLTDNKIDVIEGFTLAAGAQLDKENHEILDRYLKALNDKSDLTEYQKTVISRIIEARNCKWMKKDAFDALVSHISAGNFEEIVNGLEFTNVANASSQISFTSDDQITKFFQVIFKIVINSTEKHKIIAKFCKNAAENGKFLEYLSNFMKCRNITFLELVEFEISENVQRRLVNALLFAAELYVLGLIDEKSFEAWMAPALTKYLSCKEILKLSEIAGEKIEESENFKLMARMMNLNNVLEHGLFKIYKVAKLDLEDIKLSIGDRVCEKSENQEVVEDQKSSAE